MEHDALAAANAKIGARQLVHDDGTHVSEPLTAGLMSADGRFAYRVDEGVMTLLASRAIRLHESAPTLDPGSFTGPKLAVQQFYDEFGWKKTGENVFGDTAKFADRRAISAGALDDTHRRVKEHLDSGEYLLDVASGPVLDPYLEYASGFRCRVCVDLSMVALREAAGRVGDEGAYVIGDITNLPFADNSMDGVISLHTIYHVPRDEQSRAFSEIARVLKPERRGVVVYQWASRSTSPWRELAPVERLVDLPFRVVRRLFRIATRAKSRLLVTSAHHQPQDSGMPRVYAYSHTYQWFADQQWPFSWRIFSWSMVTTGFRQKYIHEHLFGNQILRLIGFIERHFPSLAGRLGRFPLIVIQKP
jgi:ubiquinone/menaquinone biosynthesis C-methylase UbiE